MTNEPPSITVERVQPSDLDAMRRLAELQLREVKMPEPTDEPPSISAAADAVLDAAFICGTMDSDSVYDHYDASDYLRWCAARYAEAVTGEPSYHEWDDA